MLSCFSLEETDTLQCKAAGCCRKRCMTRTGRDSPGCMHTYQHPRGAVTIHMLQVLLKPAPLLAVLGIVGVAAQHNDMRGPNIHRVVQLASTGPLWRRKSLQVRRETFWSSQSLTVIVLLNLCVQAPSRKWLGSCKRALTSIPEGAKQVNPGRGLTSNAP